MNDNTEKNKNALSFDEDSFASFEKKSGACHSSDTPLTPAIDTDDSGEASVKPVSSDEPSAEVREEGIKTDSDATSFGDGSFTSFENKKNHAASGDPEASVSHTGMGAPTGARPAYTPYVHTPRAGERRTPSAALDIFGWITFVACFPAGFIGLIVTVVSFFAGTEGAILPLCTLLAVSASSIVIGILLSGRSTKKGGAKNLVVGIITTFFLASMLLACLGGGFDFEGGDPPFDANEELIKELKDKASEVSDIDLSDGEMVYIYDDTEWGGDYKTLDLEGFENPEELYQKIKSNPCFLKTLPNELVGLMQTYDRSSEYGLYLIYNIDTKQYNCYPDKDGEYTMLSILVDYYEESELLCVRICEYKLTYVSTAESDA